MQGQANLLEFVRTGCDALSTEELGTWSAYAAIPELLPTILALRSSDSVAWRTGKRTALTSAKALVDDAVESGYPLLASGTTLFPTSYVSYRGHTFRVGGIRFQAEALWVEMRTTSHTLASQCGFTPTSDPIWPFVQEVPSREIDAMWQFEAFAEGWVGNRKWERFILAETEDDWLLYSLEDERLTIAPKGEVETARLERKPLRLDT